MKPVVIFGCYRHMIKSAEMNDECSYSLYWCDQEPPVITDM